MDNEGADMDKRKKILIGIGAALIVIAGLLAVYFLQTARSRKTVSQQTTPPPQSTATPSLSPSVTPTPLTNQMIIASADGQDLYFHHVDIVGKKVLNKQLVQSNIDGLSGGSVEENTKVQFTKSGESFYHASVLGGLGDFPPESITTSIYKSPNTLLYRTNQNEGLFSRWKVTQDGSKIYLVKTVPNAPDSREYELHVLDTLTKNVTKIASLGAIDSRLYLSGDESKVMLLERRERKENNYTYGDIYSKTVTIADGKVSEKLIWKDRQPGPTQSFDVDSLIPGPNFLKAIDDYREGTKLTMRSVDLVTQKESDIYTVGGDGQVGNIQWSPDGLKILMPIFNFNQIPTDQGVVLYNFSTGKATQLVKSNIVKQQNTVSIREVIFVDDSFNGTDFAYITDNAEAVFTDSTLYYFDGATQQSHKIVDKIGQPLAARIYK